MSCEYCEHELIDDIVCYIPTNNGDAITVPVNSCPNCGAYLSELCPLTLDEVLKRDAKPVYCIGIVNKGLNGWGLVNLSENIISDFTGDFWDINAYETEYICYDHEPSTNQEAKL